MRLRTLHLKNIRSYDEVEIAFPNGSVLLSGDIGAGKSTILLAVEFALFGLMKGSLSGAALLRHGEKDGSVRLSFDLDGKQVVIKRSLKRDARGVRQDKGSISISGSSTECTPVELRARVVEMLGYPPQSLSKDKALIYRYTVYTPQEEMKQILTANADERLDILRSVFGIDKYRRARQNVVPISRSIRSMVDQMEGRLTSFEQTKKEFAENKEKVQEIKSRLDRLAPRLEEQRSKAKAAEREMQRSQEAMTRIEKTIAIGEALRERIVHHKEEEVEVSREIAELDAAHDTLLVPTFKEFGIRPTHLGLDEVRKLLNERRAEASNLIKERSALHERYRSLSKEYETLRSVPDHSVRIEILTAKVNKRAELAERRKYAQEKIIAAERRISEVRTVIEQSTQIAETIGSLDVCPLCKQKVDAEHKHTIRTDEREKVRTAKSSLESAEADVSVAKKKLESAEAELNETDQYALELARLTSQRNDSLSRLKEVTILLAETKSRLESLPESEEVKLRKLEELAERLREFEEAKDAFVRAAERLRQNEISAAQRREQLKRIGSQLREAVEQEKGLLATLTDADTVKGRLSSSKQQVEREREALRRLELEEAELKASLRAATERAGSLADAFKELREIKSKQARLKRLRAWLNDHFSRLMEVIERHVMAQLHREFDALFRNWFDLLLEDESLSARLGTDFAPLLEQNGYDTDITNLSGGERTSLALAYRLALNKVINDYISTIHTRDLIILDEPTDGFSTEQLDRVREVLEDLRISQVILVSHEPKMESFVENIIRINKSEHLSRVM